MFPESTRTSIPIILLAIVCFTLPLPLLSQVWAEAELVTKRTISIDADHQFAYAEQRYQSNAYEQAIYEYNRFIYLFHDDTRIEKARYAIGMCYFKLARYQKAVDAFQGLVNVYEDTPIAMDAYFQLVRSYLAVRDPGQALLTLRNLITVSDDQETIDKAFYQMGWIYIDMANWSRSLRAFDQIHPQNRKKYDLRKIKIELGNADLRPQKSPDLAGLLSIFPGAGYLYTHRYQDALIAFLLNGALSFAAYESFDDGNEALGGLLSLVGIGFYGGSIFGSIASTHKYNHSHTRRFIENLKKKFRVRLAGSIRNKRIALTLRYSF